MRSKKRVSERGPGRPSMGDEAKQPYPIRLNVAERSLVERAARVVGEKPRVYARNAVIDRATDDLAKRPAKKRDE